MPTFIVERYVPRPAVSSLRDEGPRVCAAFGELDQEGDLRFLHSVYVPEDEVCFLLFEAPSTQAVAEAYLGAEVPFDRILEAELSVP
jgi:hypothetical protein